MHKNLNKRIINFYNNLKNERIYDSFVRFLTKSTIWHDVEKCPSSRNAKIEQQKFEQ